jgi:O-antigen/teichoic acid export membrane protein
VTLSVDRYRKVAPVVADSKPVVDRRMKWPRVLAGEGLAATALKGGIVLSVGSVFEQVIRFARNMVLARWLAPDAFGMMAILLSVNSAVNAFMDVGAREALIQDSRAGEAKYLQTAWLLTFARGMFLCVILTAAAPFVAAFYGNDSLAGMLRVIAAAALFDGAISSRAHLAVKELKLWKWAVVSNLGGILGVVTTIVLGFWWRSVWALVIGFASESAARCVLSFIVCPFVPRFRWYSEERRRLFGFSRGLYGLSFLNLLYARIDIFTLAKLYSPSVVGAYALSIYLVQTPVTFLLSLLSSTLLPTFANVASQRDRLCRVHVKTTKMLLIFGLPAVALIVCCAGSLIEFAYGSTYSSGATALRIAAVGSLLYVLNGEITMTFYAQGRPELHRTGVAIMALLMVVLVYPAVHWFGPSGAQAATVISVATGYSYQASRLHKLMSISWLSFVRWHTVPVFAASTVLVTFVGVRFVLHGTGPTGTVLLGVASIVAGYAVAATLLLRQQQYAPGLG